MVCFEQSEPSFSKQDLSEECFNSVAEEALTIENWPSDGPTPEILYDMFILFQCHFVLEKVSCRVTKDEAISLNHYSVGERHSSRMYCYLSTR